MLISINIKLSLLAKSFYTNANYDMFKMTHDSSIKSEKLSIYCVVVVQLLSCIDSLRPHGLKQTRLPLSFTISRGLLKLMSIELVMPSNHLILCHHLLLLPSIFKTQHQYLFQ